MKTNHSWQRDKNYQGSFDEKDLCVHCGCIRLSGWKRKKRVKHPMRVYQYYLDDVHLPTRPACTYQKEIFPDIFSEQQKQNKSAMKSLDLFNQLVKNNFNLPP